MSIANTSEFTTKGKKERCVPMNEPVLNLLKKRMPKVYKLNSNEYVFTKNGVKFNPDYISKRFKMAVRRTPSIDSKFHFHDLRHSFASNLVRKGVSIFIVKELLGHADISTTQIYAHLRAEDLRESVNLLNN
jgi:site-specific recombinase XerD